MKMGLFLVILGSQKPIYDHKVVKNDRFSSDFGILNSKSHHLMMNLGYNHHQMVIKDPNSVYMIPKRWVWRVLGL